MLAGGGTAGHVNPLLALAAELGARHGDLGLTVLGTAEGLEADLVPAAGLRLVALPRVPLPRRPSLDIVRFPGRWRRAVDVAHGAIDGTDVVVGFGGYVATPAYIAARRASVPVVVHEQNARPGLANRVGARRAAAVGVTFAGTRLPGAEHVGLPLRPAIAELVERRALDAAAARRDGAGALGLDPTRRTLLVTGGSLGAQRLNEAVVGAASAIRAAGVQVVHLAGRGKDAGVLAAVQEAGIAPGDYVVAPYLDRIEHAFACADLVIARSGAGTVCELAALGLPALYVPLPIGNGEQRLNAAGVVQAGGGLVVEDADLDAGYLQRVVVPLLHPHEAATLASMGERAASVGVRDGAARLADMVERAAGWNR